LVAGVSIVRQPGEKFKTNGERSKKRDLIVVAFFADGERDGETVAGRREWASRKRSVGARGILEAIEIENEFAGFVEAVGRETGVEKAAGGISVRGTGGVTQDEE
jgi:hypothetical protein